MMDIKTMQNCCGMSLTQFAAYFGIPYRTVQNWALKTRECPAYLLELMEYKLRNEKMIK